MDFSVGTATRFRGIGDQAFSPHGGHLFLRLLSSLPFPGSASASSGGGTRGGKEIPRVGRQRFRQASGIVGGLAGTMLAAPIETYQSFPPGHHETVLIRPL